MADDSPVFLVDPYSKPIAIKIVGRASFQNVAPLKDFLEEAYSTGGRDFVFDFSECAGMDSTVLGVLAGCALDLRRMQPRGSMVLCRLGPRNRELVENLGLHRLATVDFGNGVMGANGATQELASKKIEDEVENARICLEAHESLVEADDSNRAKFQDVISFLKNRVEDDDT